MIEGLEVLTLDKSLICKIVVTTKTGNSVRGTGYLVAAGRILTAAHVVENAADRPQAIQLYFGENNKRHDPDDSPTVCWNGKVQGCNGRRDVDVAVINGKLPDELSPKTLRLPTDEIQATEFQGCGLSAAGRVAAENGFYDFSGDFPLATGETHEHSVDCKNGPEAEDDTSLADLWSGVSGACVFDKHQNRLLAVVTHHVGRHKLPRLKVVPMPFLLRDQGFRNAIRFGAAADGDRRNELAREKLRVLAEKVLKSEATRKFILKCNDLPESMSASELAIEIFNAPEPMSFLRRCVRQADYQLEFAAKKTELRLNMCRLTEIVAPVCFAEGDLDELERHLNHQATHAEIETCDRVVAKSRVAFIKKVSVNLEDGCEWETVSDSILPGGRESVTSIPHPPELGIFADGSDGSEDIVESFRIVLLKILRPDAQSLTRVQVALKDQTEFDKVFLCVLFPTQIGAASLKRLNEAFPELVLLTARDVDDGPHQRVLDQIQRIREEFAPQPVQES